MCIYVYACVYICVYADACIHIYVYVDTYMYVHTHACTKCICIHICLCVCVYKDMYIHRFEIGNSTERSSSKLDIAEERIRSWKTKLKKLLILQY